MWSYRVLLRCYSCASGGGILSCCFLLYSSGGRYCASDVLSTECSQTEDQEKYFYDKSAPEFASILKKIFKKFINSNI
jgi:hypothetical protein